MWSHFRLYPCVARGHVIQPPRASFHIPNTDRNKIDAYGALSPVPAAKDISNKWSVIAAVPVQ